MSAHEWSQSRSGAIELADTDDIVFYPALVDLAPGESRTIRVGTTVTAQEVERTYRMFIEELPGEAPASSGVRVLTRVGVPVFVAPEHAVTSARFTDARLDHGKLTVTLQNAGTTHFQARAIHVVGSRGKEQLFAHEESAWYVLAKGARDFTITVPDAACLSDVFRITLSAAEAEAVMELPGGCH